MANVSGPYTVEVVDVLNDKYVQQLRGGNTLAEADRVFSKMAKKYKDQLHWHIVQIIGWRNGQRVTVRELRGEEADRRFGPSLHLPSKRRGLSAAFGAVFGTAPSTASAMHLVYLPVNQAWALFFGIRSPLQRLRAHAPWSRISLTVGSADVWSWPTKEDAERDLNAAGLSLGHGKGRVYPVVAS